jgi:predicted secreted protein
MHKKGFVACLLALALAAFPVFAGDAAAFQNLGFSADGRYFMFAQYGVSESGSLPYAQIFTVDVPRNRFVPGGTRKTTAKTVVEPGTDGRGALFNLLAEVLPLKKKYAIDHTRTGRLLYILMDGALPLPELEFRDFQADKKYKVVLNQSSAGSGSGIKASFHLVITVEDSSGNLRSYTAGDPDYWREGVRGYRIRQILLAPDGRSLVIAVERSEEDPAGASIRYMVETLKL